MLLGEGSYAGKRLMEPGTVRLMMSNLLPEGVLTPNRQGFGAAGQVLIQPNNNGQGLGTYRWAGVGSTLMWSDPTYTVHAPFLSQYIPLLAFPVPYVVPRDGIAEL